MVFLWKRLLEPSTWAAIATLLAIFGIHADSQTLSYIATAGAAMAAGTAAVVPETGTYPVGES